jgi:hypothetical protein
MGSTFAKSPCMLGLLSFRIQAPSRYQVGWRPIDAARALLLG